LRARRDDTGLPLWDDTIGTFGTTEKRAICADDVQVASALTVDDRLQQAGSAGAPRLRLTAKGVEVPESRAQQRRDATRARDPHAPRRGADARPPVLIAGGDAATRAQVRDELAAVMPGGIRIEELGTLWQLLARAPESRAVILSGELDDVPAESLLHTLAHRHPHLPVVTVGAAARPAE
jgi:hypothetical protein